MVIMLNKPCYIYQLSVLYILEIFFINFWGDISTEFEWYFVLLCGRGEVLCEVYNEYFHFYENRKGFQVHEEKIPWMWILDLNFKKGLPSGKW